MITLHVDNKFLGAFPSLTDALKHVETLIEDEWLDVLGEYKIVIENA